MFIRSVLGKSKMSWLEYIFNYCIPTGFDSIRFSFLTWMDLVWFEDNQKGYTLLPDDVPLEQCRLYFWDGLNDIPYSKEFVEYLYEMSEQVKRGEVELIPFTKEMFNEIRELVDIEDDYETGTGGREVP